MRPVIRSTGIFRISDLLVSCSGLMINTSHWSVCDARSRTLTRIFHEFVCAVPSDHILQFKFRNPDSKHLLLPGAGRRDGYLPLPALPTAVFNWRQLCGETTLIQAFRVTEE